MTTTRTTLAGLTLAGALLVAASGCGDSKSLSREELIAKSDPICHRANRALDSSKINPQNLSRVAPLVGATFTQVAAELGRLHAPSSMTADWKTIVAGFRRSGLALEKVGQVAKTSNLTRPSPRLIEAENAFTTGQHDRAVIAERNGFADCSKY